MVGSGGQDYAIISWKLLEEQFPEKCGPGSPKELLKAAVQLGGLHISQLLRVVELL